ncbi:hypothetical protein V5O48_008297 [Marasmius crinis-equi]|uniref:protein-tyrosine-phosphatase n=1 Tax=Marasmius crinis-equi TaxID=585013 RepID=A0ABR3FEH2_9AGAR
MLVLTTISASAKLNVPTDGQLATMLKSNKIKRPPPNLSLHTRPIHDVLSNAERLPVIADLTTDDDAEVLTLGSDDELEPPTTSSTLDDDFQALHQLRESVKQNLRLRPIKSSSNLRHQPDPLPPPPLSSASDYFTPLSPSAPKQAHPIHPTSLASRLSGQNSWGGEPAVESGCKRLPLLIDTRPPATHMQSHIRDSINIAIPSLILKRIAKSNNPPATLPTLHSLRQFISTETGKTTWDAYLASYAPGEPDEPNGSSEDFVWDGDIIIYDHDIRSHPKDASFKVSSFTAFTLLPLLQALLPPGGSVDYLYGSMNHPALTPFIVGQTPQATTPPHSKSGNTLTISHSTTNEATTPGSSGLFNLDTQIAAKSKQKAYQIETNSATSSHPPSPLPIPKSPLPLNLQPPKSPMPAPLSIPPLSRTPKSKSHTLPPPKSPSPFSATSTHASASSNTPSPPPSFLQPPTKRPSVPSLRTNTTSLEKLPKLSTSFPSLSLRNRATSSVVPPTQPSLSLVISSTGQEEKRKNGTSKTAPTSPVTHFGNPTEPLPSIITAINTATTSHRPRGNSITSPIYSAYYTPPHTPSQVFPSYADAFSAVPPDPPISEAPSITPKAGRSPTTAKGSGEWPPIPPPPVPSISAALSSSSHWAVNGDPSSGLMSPDYDEPPRPAFDKSFDRPFADSPPTTSSAEDEGEAIPGFVVSTILPGFLYLGPAPTSSEHVTTLVDLGVKRILNLAMECNQDDYGLGLESAFEKYTKISLRDIVEEDAIARGVREVCEVLDSARLHSSATYVHCKAGKSRSVTAVIAYLIHSHHWTLGRAYKFVCERRKGISPNIGFVSELMSFEEEEIGGKSIGVVHPSHHAHGHNGGHHGHQPVNRVRKISNMNGNGDGPGHHGASQSISGPIMSSSITSTSSSVSSSGSSVGADSSPSLSSTSTLPTDYEDGDSDPPSSGSTPDASTMTYTGAPGKSATLPSINTTFANSEYESSKDGVKPSSTAYHHHQIPLSAQEPSYSGYGHDHGHGVKKDLGGPLTPLSTNNPSHDPFQEMEIRDSSGRYRHARRAPVDEQTLQPMRRVSKAGLESWGWNDDEY